jgi:hypothetical protein
MLSSRYDYNRSHFMFTRNRQCYEPPPEPSTPPIRSWDYYIATVLLGAFLAGLLFVPQVLSALL